MSQTKKAGVLPVRRSEKGFSHKEISQLETIVNSPDNMQKKLKDNFATRFNRHPTDVHNYVYKRRTGLVKGRGREMDGEKAVPKKKTVKASSGKAKVPTLPQGTSEIRVPIKSWHFEGNILVIKFEN